MTRFRYLTAGESHGKALSTIIEGVPAGLPLDEEYIATELRRRQGGYGRGSRMKIEQDRAEILSGVRYGLTIGSPIALLIKNRDWENWKEVMNTSVVVEEAGPVTHLRPGHADLAGTIKYGFKDVRPILERASARETAARVAVGAVARRLLEEFDIVVHSHTVAIGKQSIIPLNPPKSPFLIPLSPPLEKGDLGRFPIDWQQVENSPVRCANAEVESAMIKEIDAARAAGDSIGGVFEVIATGVPVGLGSHVHWDRRLDGRIAQAMMSINAVKGVEIGDGFAVASLPGSQSHDVIEPVFRNAYAGATKEESPYPWRHITNHAGGIEGGISNGEPIVVKAAVKPIPTLANPLPSIDLITGEPMQAHVERSDVCVVPAAGVIGEAMLAIVLADVLLEKFGGDSLGEMKENYRAYMESITTRMKRG